jgi:hypothetical protein
MRLERTNKSDERDKKGDYGRGEESLLESATP